MIALYNNQLTHRIQSKQIKRRIFKSLEPVESMPFNKNAKYIFVARDFRDIVWSYYNQYTLLTEAAFAAWNAEKYYEFKPFPSPKTLKYPDGDYEGDNDGDIGFTQYDLWKQMVYISDGIDCGDNQINPDGWPMHSQLWLIGSWWNIRNLPNVKILHYDELQLNLSKTMREIAQFLDIKIDEDNFNNLVKNCTFEEMEAHQKYLPQKAMNLFKDPAKFFNDGKGGHWRDTLTSKDINDYRLLAKRYLNQDGINWLETGKLP